MPSSSRIVAAGIFFLVMMGVGQGAADSLAQSPTPAAGVGAAPAPLSSLEIALWPEYDRPGVLVIFRGQLADAQSPPAPVSFTLPATVPALNAVAYMDETRNTLVNITPYSFAAGAGGKLLTFSTPARRFQFEYYADDLLTRQGSTRTLQFSFAADSDVAGWGFEVQQPVGAHNFTSAPPPTSTETRPDGLTYAVYRLGAAPAGQARSLQVIYTRDADELSVKSLGINIPAASDQPVVEVGGSSGLSNTMALILIAAGVVLVAGAVGYWVWSRREPAGAPPGRANLATRNAPAAPRPAPPGASQNPAVYCHRCGTRLRDDALFCHKCGTERRTD
jgi:hypothetical protein